MAAEPPPSWSSIPLDLAGQVLRLLPAYADRARFAAVCPHWRAAARQQFQTQPLPLLALPDGTFYSLPYAKPFRFPGQGFAGYQSVCGKWLVYSRDDGCFLVDTFSRDTVALPSLSCVRLRPPNAAVAKWSDKGWTKVTWMHINDSENLRIKKLILCSPNLVAALVGIGYSTQILMCQPGGSAWSVRAYDECKTFEDMVFYQGKLYAIATDENLLVVNTSEDHNTGEPQVSMIRQVIKGDPVPWFQSVIDDEIMHCQKTYLVESCGALLMVRRTIWCRFPEPGTDEEIMAGQNEFEVFKADFEHSRWDKVTTVGADQRLYLGRRCSRAVSVSQYDFPGDMILFLDDDEENRVDYAYEDENTSFCSYDMTLGDVSSPHPNISWKQRPFSYEMTLGEVSWPHPNISWKRRPEMRLAAWLFPQD